MSKLNRIILLPILLLLSVFCEDRSELTEPELPETGEADFSKYISIGNSLTAGFQNGALYESAQRYSYGKLIADQVGADFIQPTIEDPGIGGRLEVVSLEPLLFANQGILGGFPNNSGYDSTFNNLGVPGAILSDLLNASDAPSSSSSSNVFFDIILRGKGSVIDQLKNFEPSLVTLWIGNNDILGYATSGGSQSFTPQDSFSVSFDKLGESLSEGEYPVFIANIPDVRTIPYFTTLSPLFSERIVELQMEDSTITEFIYEIEDNSLGSSSIEELSSNKILITLRGSSALEFIGDKNGEYYQSTGTSIPSDVDISYPFGLSVQNPFPNNFVLDSSEQIIIDNIISSYNSTIASITLKYNFYLVDMNTFFNNIAGNGLIVEGVNFSTDFISGGLFSLDGIHPTNQGYAIIANEFIKEINQNLSANIPMVDVTTISGSLEFAKLGKASKTKIPTFQKNTFEYPFY